MFNNYRQAGSAAVKVLDEMKENLALRDQLKVVVKFLNDIETDDEASSEFAIRICDLLTIVHSCENISHLSY